MKKMITLMITAMLIFCSAMPTMAEIKIISPNFSPSIVITYPDMQIVDGYAMIRVRGFFETMDSRNTKDGEYFSYNWDQSTKKLVISSPNCEDYCTIIVGDKAVKYNDENLSGQDVYGNELQSVFNCDIAARIIDGSLYVQEKAFCGYTLPGVYWDKESNSVKAGS